MPSWWKEMSPTATGYRPIDATACIAVSCASLRICIVAAEGVILLELELELGPPLSADTAGVEAETEALGEAAFAEVLWLGAAFSSACRAASTSAFWAQSAPLAVRKATL